MFRLSNWLCHDKNFAFAFGAVSGAIISAVVTGTTISSSLTGGMGQSGKPF